MIRARTKQGLKLRLLAFVLTFALVWYSINPAPTPVIRKKREAEPPDEKRRNAVPKSMLETLSAVFKPTGEAAEPLQTLGEDEDDFEWPEFIDG
jgi:hypothetical protein